MIVHREPLVSVVLPTYNRRDYLGQAIQSVLSQSYGNLELIVVDDGSSDHTAAVVSGSGDDRVRYLHQPHSGRSVARNRGLEAAKGQYIGLLDDDDLYLEHKLTWQAQFLNTNPNVDLVASGTQTINESGAVTATWRTWRDQPELTLLNCLYDCPLPTCTVLFRRSVLERLDHWFDPQMNLAEDTDFFIRLLHAGSRMAWLETIVSAYRRHPYSSQMDNEQYSHSYQALLNKVFARPDLPREVLEHRTRLHAHFYMYGACRAYAAGQIEAAQDDLKNALALQLDLGQGRMPSVATQIASYADTFWVEEPHAFIRYVFSHLPPSLKYLRRYLRSTKSILHMTRVFTAHAAGERPSLKDLLLGVWYEPRWLFNRGVWSILLRDSLGLPLPRRNRAHASLA